MPISSFDLFLSFAEWSLSLVICRDTSARVRTGAMSIFFTTTNMTRIMERPISVKARARLKRLTRISAFTKRSV
ncbi:MAG: hypothetical protein A4E61_01879 [Syntrophorhabdus sp. PtaB.Bin184]|nr:MAG: hypothetical protein A4E61_01879 [Syntrophorhabdus sp. PtaB.Bin184]